MYIIQTLCVHNRLHIPRGQHSHRRIHGIFHSWKTHWAKISDVIRFSIHFLFSWELLRCAFSGFNIIPAGGWKILFMILEVDWKHLVYYSFIHICMYSVYKHELGVYSTRLYLLEMKWLAGAWYAVWGILLAKFELVQRQFNSNNGNCHIFLPTKYLLINGCIQRINVCMCAWHPQELRAHGFPHTRESVYVASVKNHASCTLYHFTFLLLSEPLCTIIMYFLRLPAPYSLFVIKRVSTYRV